MKLIVIITTLLYASSSSATAAHEFGESNLNTDHFNIDIEDFETILLSANTNPATCTQNCRCPLSNPSCTLSACTTNCKCQHGSCTMPACTTNCKCQSGGCDMPKCTRNCKCQAGNCPMPACKAQCKCMLGGCFSSEQEEFLLAMEQDSEVRVPNHMPKLRGAKQVMPATTLDHSHESLTSVANSYRNTAQALLKTASLAMDLATVEDLPSIKVAKDQVMRAAEVAQSLGDDAADKAEEVLKSNIGVQHRSSRALSAEQMFYYSSGKAAQKTNRATQKAARKTEQATSKAERKTEQAVNKAGRKTESAIQKANYKTASAVAKAETAAASSFLNAAGALDNAATLTADAISLGTTEAANAANLAAYEASNAVAIANDSLSYAAEITASALNW